MTLLVKLVSSRRKGEHREAVSDMDWVDTRNSSWNMRLSCRLNVQCRKRYDHWRDYQRDLAIRDPIFAAISPEKQPRTTHEAHDQVKEQMSTLKTRCTSGKSSFVVLKIDQYHVSCKHWSLTVINEEKERDCVEWNSVLRRKLNQRRGYVGVSVTRAEDRCTQCMDDAAEGQSFHGRHELLLRFWSQDRTRLAAPRAVFFSVSSSNQCFFAHRCQRFPSNVINCCSHSQEILVYIINCNKTS